MDKKDFYYYNLPFWKDLTSLGEAMQYAFHGEATSDYQIKNKKFWVKEIIERVKPEVCEQIKAFKTENAEFLAESPVLNALLDTYLAMADTKDPEKLKTIYTAFINIQKDLPFEENKAAYVDAGCSFSSGFGGGKAVSVLFPISLYGGYDPQGQRDDDHRGGYLWPSHVLSNEDIKELAEARPALLKELKNFKEAYEKVSTSQPNGPTGN